MNEDQLLDITPNQIRKVLVNKFNKIEFMINYKNPITSCKRTKKNNLYKFWTQHVLKNNPKAQDFFQFNNTCCKLKKQKVLIELGQLYDQVLISKAFENLLFQIDFINIVLKENKIKAEITSYQMANIINNYKKRFEGKNDILELQFKDKINKSREIAIKINHDRFLPKQIFTDNPYEINKKFIKVKAIALLKMEKVIDEYYIEVKEQLSKQN